MDHSTGDDDEIDTTYARRATMPPSMSNLTTSCEQNDGTISRDNIHFFSAQIEPTPINHDQMEIVSYVSPQETFDNDENKKYIYEILRCMGGGPWRPIVEEKTDTSQILPQARSASLPRVLLQPAQQAPITQTATPPPNRSTTTRKRHIDLWEVRYAQLVSYQRTHGHCLVETHQDKVLSNWVRRQRYQYKQKIKQNYTTLSDERQAKLELIGFVWDSHNMTWDHHFQTLVAFKDMFGHTNVPADYPENPPLGVWVRGQRRDYRLHQEGGKQTQGWLERARRLEGIGFQWVVRPPRTTTEGAHAPGDMDT